MQWVLLVLLLVALAVLGCGDDPNTPPEWKTITTTLPSQHLGQTGTPRLPPPATAMTRPAPGDGP